MTSRLCYSPFDQFHSDEVVSISTVEDEETIRWCGFELKEQVHCGVRLQSSQAQVTALRLEGYRVSDDEPHAETRVQFTEVDVAVFAHVNVLHAVKLQALWGGWNRYRWGHWALAFSSYAFWFKLIKLCNFNSWTWSNNIWLRRSRWNNAPSRTQFCPTYLKMANKGGGSRGDKSPLCQNARLHVVEFQTGVVTCHFA